MARTMFSNIVETLPLDIWDRVLIFVPDFLSLRQAVLTSKHIYDTYSSRKRSIMRAVEFNEIGLALSYAAALVRTKNEMGRVPLQDILKGLNNLSSNSPYWTIDVTAKEAQELSRVSSVVRRLEVFFSVYYKDRTAPVSILTELESFKFHRAIYRIWIVGVLANDRHRLSKASGLDMNFLKTLCEEELVEMHETMLFLDALHRYLMMRHSQFQGYFNQAARPLQVELDDFVASFDGRISTAMFGGSLSRSGSAIVNGIGQLLLEKQVIKVFRDKYGSHSVLTNSRIEGIQACQHCDAQTQELYGENNWHLLHTAIDLGGLSSCLPGRLAYSDYVRIDFSSLLNRRSSYASMIDEMFASQNDPESSWRRTDWFCVDCIKEFLKERLFSWFVKELVKDGYKFEEENCWYGWNCRTQTHRPEHAKKLNHLCEPSSRDDAQ